MINLGNWSLRNMRSVDVDVWMSDRNIVWNHLYSTMKPVLVNAIPRSTTGTRSSVKHSMIERGIRLLAPADVLKSFTFTTDMVSKIWVQVALLNCYVEIEEHGTIRLFSLVLKSCNLQYNSVGQSSHRLMVRCLFWEIWNNSVRQWLSDFDLGHFKRFITELLWK